LLVTVEKVERSNYECHEKAGAVTMSSVGWVSKALSFEGYPYSYTCEREDESSNQPLVKTTKIFFDFEFVLPNPEEPIEEVLIQDLPKVEYGILNQLIKVTGLGECDLEKQLSDPWLDSDVGDSRVMSGENLVLGLTSFEPDTPDPVGKSARTFSWLPNGASHAPELSLFTSWVIHSYSFSFFLLKETASLLQTWLKV
jgi:hypothetical protein